MLYFGPSNVSKLIISLASRESFNCVFFFSQRVQFSKRKRLPLEELLLPPGRAMSCISTLHFILQCQLTTWILSMGTSIRLKLTFIRFFGGKTAEQDQNLKRATKRKKQKNT